MRIPLDRLTEIFAAHTEMDGWMLPSGPNYFSGRLWAQRGSASTRRAVPYLANRCNYQAI